MWKIIKLCFGLVLLVIAIHGDGTNDALKKTLFEMADQGYSIDGNFKPLKDGPRNGVLGEGGCGVVFKGKMSWGNRTKVAMKFINLKHLDNAKREYEICSYLNAVDNPKIEKFGIPNVYYYNEWNDHMLTVFSYFDGGDLVEAYGKGYLNEHIGNRYINSLILFREFVRQSKYLHSRGVRHDDIKPENIMLRKHRSFLVDFDGSSKMNEDKRGGTFDYVSRKFGKVARNALCDWEAFLYTMCRIHSVPLKWFDSSHFKHLEDQRLKILSSGKMKANFNETINHIKDTIRSPPLKRIFLLFANEIFQNRGKFPDYDGMYDAINAEIGSSPGFTWLTPEQIREAQEDLNRNPLPDIRKDIADPRKFNSTYNAVNFERFL